MLRVLLAGLGIGGSIPDDEGALCGGAGPPTPRIGAVRPGAADSPPVLTGKLPRLTGTLRPGPSHFASTCLRSRTGGASGKIDMMFSPLRRTRPSIRFTSFSASSARGLIVRYSSQSASTTFICLSNAMKVPTMTLVS